ncbi:MAG: hypothetical protein IJ268_09800 [Proteobacteria bacterium]|nr:hypothetical protein [Pseudomonadota bacterium]
MLNRDIYQKNPETLQSWSLSMLRDRFAALPARFDRVAKAVAELCEPEVLFVDIPHRVLKTEDELDSWLDEVRAQILSAMADGPVQVK